MKNEESHKKIKNSEEEGLKTCDTILLLKGWEKSKGTKKELQVAIENNLNIVQEELFVDELGLALFDKSDK